jgi:heme/copper-type cytochrome/quinol oxidase subunit 2
MNFNSLTEYFYKVYNLCLIMVIVPMVAFLTVYYLVVTGKIHPTIHSEKVLLIILISFPILMIIDLTVVHLVVRNRLVALAKEVSLGVRLEKYFGTVTPRFSAVVATGFFMAAGLYLTAHDFFTYYFLFLVGWLFFQWPTPRRVCKDLKLKGDEETMVMTKGEAFK